MKKTITCLLTVLLTIATFTSCSSAKPAENSNTTQIAPTQSLDANQKKLSIVATTFPQYDWVRQILGEKVNDVELTLLLDNGVDLHSFQPTVEDIAKISTSDMFIYVGGESDAWVQGALETATNKDMTVINMLEVLGDRVKEEEIVEGMEGEHEEEQGEGESETEEHEADEHVWLSLKNAQIICADIASKLEILDPQNADVYKTNTENYIKLLTNLDGEYKNAVDNAPVKTLLFGDRFPFRYLVDDYGLQYYGAFVGCSAETEASFETVVFLANKVNELNLKNILIIDNTNDTIAKTISENSNNKDQKILSLDSMQAVTAEDVSNGATYLSIMESNLKVLKESLS